MAYITYQQYLDIYGTCPIREDNFPVYAGLASDIIDAVTQYRIVEGGGFSALPALVQEQVTQATGAQVLYYIQIGLETILTGQTGQSFTVGKVSVSGGGLANGSNTSAQLTISPFARILLEQSGLMGRGVHVCSDRFLNPFWGI